MKRPGSKSEMIADLIENEFYKICGVTIDEVYKKEGV